MANAEQICVVEAVFFIKGRGIVITPGNWRGGEIQLGDWIDLRSSIGESNLARVVSFEMVRFAPGVPKIIRSDQEGSLLLAGISRDSVMPGMEIWSVVK